MRNEQFSPELARRAERAANEELGEQTADHDAEPDESQPEKRPRLVEEDPMMPQPSVPEPVNEDITMEEETMPLKELLVQENSAWELILGVCFQQSGSV